MAAASPHADPDRCPWCGSVIPRTRFHEIKAQIAEDERRRLTEERSRLLQEFEEREARTRKNAVAQAEAKLRSENDKATQQLARRIRELEAVNRDHQRELREARSALEKDRDAQVQKARSDHHRELEKLQQKIDGLKRQLEHKTASELGDGAEIDSYEALRDAFPHDRIDRIKKGIPGADIRHQVLYNGVPCGTILIDSKDRQGWQNGYVSKLREDQLADRAEHAVLATTVFPSGKKELFVDVDTEVIVVHRGRIVEVVCLLRRALVQMHRQGLSQKKRAEKRDRLYEYIASEQYRQRLTEADRLTTLLLDLDVEETRGHQKNWEKRGKMIKRLENVIHEVDGEISSVLETSTTGAAD